MHISEAQKLFELSKGKNIPVRLDIKRSGVRGKEGNRNGHYARGDMVGVDGRLILVKPHAHGGRVEKYDPQHVKVWTSRAVQNGCFTKEELNMKTERGLALSEDDRKLINGIISEHHESESQRYLIVEKDHIVHGLRFFAGKNSYKSFVDKLESAQVYEGEKGLANARRAMGKIKSGKRNKKNVDFNNLDVISFESAQEILEKKGEEPSQIDSKGGENISEAQEEKSFADDQSASEVEYESPVKPIESNIVERIASSSDFNSLLSEVQEKSTSVKMAADMLKEEISALRIAKEKLVNSLMSQIGDSESLLLDSEIEMGKK